MKPSALLRLTLVIAAMLFVIAVVWKVLDRPKESGQLTRSIRLSGQQERRVPRDADETLRTEIASSPDATTLSLNVLDDETGEAIALARVEARFRWMTEKESDRRVISATSDSQGIARLELSPEETPFFLAVSAPRYGTRRISGDAVRGEKEIVVALSPSARLGGRVITSEGTPIEGAAVWVAESTRADRFVGIWQPRPAASRSGAEGRFAIDGLPTSDDVVLEVHRDGFLPARYGPLRADAGETEDSIEIVLRRGGYAIQGTVVGPAQTPVEGAAVELEGPDSVDLLGQSPMDVEPPDFLFWPERTTAADGRFRFEGLVPGDYTVRCRAWGYVPQDAFRLRVSEERSERSLEIELVRSARIGGHVEDEMGNPLAGVTVHGAGGEPPVMTDASGSFRLPPSAIGQARFTKPGFVEVWKSLHAGQEPCRVVLRRAARLRVQLVDAEGRTEFPAWVLHVVVTETRVNPEGQWLGTSQDRLVSDPRGRTALDVIPGTVRVVANVDGYLTSEAELFLLPGEDKTAELSLERGATLVGRVVWTDDGSGVAGALVAVKDGLAQLPRFLAPHWGHDLNRDFARGCTDETGRFRVTGLPAPESGERYSPATWRVWARASDGSFASSHAVQLATIGQTEIIIGIERHARLSGRIAGFGDPERVRIPLEARRATWLARHAPGSPAEGPIHLSDVLRTGAALAVDVSSLSGKVPVRPDGAFEVEGIPAGSVTVRFLDWSETVTLSPGEHREVVIDPARAGDGRARFTLCDDPLEVLSASVGLGFELPVDPDGVVERIPLGARTIQLFSSDGESWPKVALRNSGANPEEIRLPCGAIEGVVVEPRAEVELAFQSDSRIEAFRLETPGQDMDPNAVPEACCARFNSLLGGGEEPFRLRGLRAGRYRVVVTPPAPFQRLVSEPIDLAEGERRTGLRFVLERPRETTALSLHLQSRDVWSEESVIVHLIRPAVGEEYPDRDGLVTFPELAPGRYLGAVELEEAGRRGVTTPFVVTVPTERVVPVLLSPPARINVTVTSPRGTPVVSARVEVLHESGVDMFRETWRGNHESLTDRDGRLLIDGLAPGIYHFRPFRGRPVAGEPVTVKVEEDRIHDLRLTLEGE